MNEVRNHKIVDALKFLRSDEDIVEVLKNRDPNRTIETVLLSLINRDIPSCADFNELAWLYGLGYRNMMLCDELCLREDLLDIAIGAFDAFRGDHP